MFALGQPFALFKSDASCYFIPIEEPYTHALKFSIALNKTFALLKPDIILFDAFKVYIWLDPFKVKIQ